MSQTGDAGQPQLFMRQPDLNDLPAAPLLPPGWVLREAVPADYEQMAGILAEGFAEPWDAARVAGEFSLPNGVQATFVAVSPASGAVAMAAARQLPDRFPGAGYLHYVGARTAERGRHLGEIVTRRVLECFAGSGLPQAVLETDDFRLPAIRTYLRLGFVPEPRVPGDMVRWSRVLRVLSGGPPRQAAADPAAPPASTAAGTRK